MCKSWCELIIGLVIALFALFWWTLSYTRWVVLVAALLLIIHSFMCKHCWCSCDKGCKMHGEKEMTKSKKK